MRRTTLSISFLVLYYLSVGSLFGQTVTDGFKFWSPVKPNDTPTVTGKDLTRIVSVVLRADGKTDLTAPFHATDNSISFTVPQTANGAYNLVLSPGSIAPIPLTVDGCPSASSGPGSDVHIYMPDGQLGSHLIRVYVSPDIPASQKPKLRLLRSHAVTKIEPSEIGCRTPVVIANNQQWSESVDGQPVVHPGTLLLFDLSNTDFQLKPMIRGTPVISWTDGNGDRIAVGSRDVNIGNIVSVFVWTLVVVAVVLVAILALSWRKAGNPLLFLTAVDGHLSLAQTQVACWTIVVGGVVLGYGFVKLDIPEIPASLLALMGASLATGGVGFFQDAKKQQAAAADANLAKRKPAWRDLLLVFPLDGGDGEPSLAKGQMLFWTLLLLILFVSKSILDGGIWDIPWTLVALMGFSQAGYLAPKLALQPPAPDAPQPEPPKTEPPKTEPPPPKTEP